MPIAKPPSTDETVNGGFAMDGRLLALPPFAERQGTLGLARRLKIGLAVASDVLADDVKL